MTLDKAIEHHKEHRKPYRGGKAIFVSCRNHGGCDWCLANRMYQLQRQNEKSKYDMFECGVTFKLKPIKKGTWWI